MKLTEKFVKTAGVPDGLTEKWYADDDQPGLFLRVQRTSSGFSRTYMIRYTIPGQPQRKLRVGEPSRTTLARCGPEESSGEAHDGGQREGPEMEQELRSWRSKSSTPRRMRSYARLRRPPLMKTVSGSQRSAGR